MVATVAVTAVTAVLGTGSLLGQFLVSRPAKPEAKTRRAAWSLKA